MTDTVILSCESIRIILNKNMGGSCNEYFYAFSER